MITLHQLRLQNHIVFRDLIWKMDKYPLQVVRGLNLDRRSHSANGVGKSLLAASISNLITEAPPLAVKKRAARDLVFDKARIELQLTNGDTRWDIVQFARNKSVNYSISRDNKPLDVKAIDTARKFIQQAIPFSDDHIYSQFYISSYRPSVLAVGSAARRMDYFESVFELRIYDAMRRALLRELQEVNAKAAQQQILHKQKAQLAEAGQKDLAPRIAKARQRRDKLRRQLEELNQQHADLNGYITLAEQLSSEASLVELQRQRRQYDGELTRLDHRLRKLQRRLGAARTQKKIYKARKRIIRRLSALPASRGVEELQRLQNALNGWIDKLETIVERYYKFERFILRYHAIAASVQNIPSPSERKLDKLQQQLAEHKFHLKQRRKVQVGQPCPLCGQVVQRQQHAEEIARLRQIVAEDKNRLFTAESAAFVRKLQEKLPQEILTCDIGDVQQRLDQQRQKARRIAKELNIAQRRQELRRQLRRLPSITEYATVDRTQLRAVERELNKTEEARNRVNHDIRLLQKLAEMQQPYENITAARRAHRGILAAIGEISPALNKVSDKLHRFSVQQSEYNAARRQLQEIEAELSEIDKVVENKDILQALAEAYSAKGIRVMQINSLANAYTTALNNLAPSLYPEPIKFHAEVAPNLFSIVAERHGKIGDVRSLSGSESRQFLAVSALALISLMPDSLRCSHLVLDELEAGIDQKDLTLFTHEFIPALTAVIPNLVLITPRSQEEMPIPNAAELLLVRKNGVTTWGHANTQEQQYG